VAALGDAGSLMPAPFDAAVGNVSSIASRMVSGGGAK
jgi:hypothetical protein